MWWEVVNARVAVCDPKTKQHVGHMVNFFLNRERMGATPTEAAGTLKPAKTATGPAGAVARTPTAMASLL